MLRRKTKRQKSLFFLLMGITGILAIFIGFAKTFTIPVAAGTFKAPFSIYLHGVFAFGWVLLFVVQAFLIKSGNYKLHSKLGIPGAVIALGAAVTIIPAGLFQIERELQLGLGDTAISVILGTVISAVVFLLLVIFGVIYKRSPQAHKRLMLLATLVLLWPAWFRFRHYFLSVPRPDIWFGFILADLFIAIAIVWDKLQNGRIHPVLGIIGSLIILEHALEVLAFDSHYWRILSRYLYGIFV